MVNSELRRAAVATQGESGLEPGRSGCGIDDTYPRRLY
jgi:hypothetical protein